MGNLGRDSTANIDFYGLRPNGHQDSTRLCPLTLSWLVSKSVLSYIRIIFRYSVCHKKESYTCLWYETHGGIMSIHSAFDTTLRNCIAITRYPLDETPSFFSQFHSGCAITMQGRINFVEVLRTTTSSYHRIIVTEFDQTASSASVYHIPTTLMSCQSSSFADGRHHSRSLSCRHAALRHEAAVLALAFLVLYVCRWYPRL